MAQSLDWDDCTTSSRSLEDETSRLPPKCCASILRACIDSYVALERQLSSGCSAARDGYRPTAQGEALADAASRMEIEVLTVERQILGSELQLSGLIRVGTSELLGLHLLPPLLREFASRFPDVDIALSLDNRLVDLARRGAGRRRSRHRQAARAPGRPARREDGLVCI